MRDFGRKAVFGPRSHPNRKMMVIPFSCAPEHIFSLFARSIDILDTKRACVYTMSCNDFEDLFGIKLLDNEKLFGNVMVRFIEFDEFGREMFSHLKLTAEEEKKVTKHNIYEIPLSPEKIQEVLDVAKEYAKIESEEVVNTELN